MKIGETSGCEVEVEGPDGAYIDFSDSGPLSSEEARCVERLLAAANAAEVYRKALEPFALRFAEAIGPEALDVRTSQEIEAVVWLERDERDALRAACRLMDVSEEGA